MKTRVIRRWLAAAALLTSAAAYQPSAAAAVPATIMHQGRLYDANDNPISGTIDVQFSLYDAPAAAVPIWTEVHTITFDEGYYTAALGSLVPFGATVFDGSVRYFGLKVGNDAEMTPRAEVASVP